MNIHTSYREAEQYILDIPKFAGKHTLEDTRKLYDILIPTKIKSKILHVAGTNGKGSVCTYMRAMLEEAGFTVGVFTSPHLLTMRERICIGTEMISEEDFVNAYEKVKCTVAEMQKQMDNSVVAGSDALDSNAPQINIHPSFFEYIFLMAMVYFAQNKPDYIILETGLGGRLDATNMIPKKEVAVITRIGIDHTEYLGNTLEEIAGEKAGIMKQGTPVVYWENAEAVNAVFIERARNLQIEAHPVSKGDYTFLNFNHKSIDFSYRSIYYGNIRLCLSTIAQYQMENATLALRTLEVLLGAEVLTPQVMQAGLVNAFWAGRMEEIAPDIFVDGAHNGDGIRAFLETVSGDGCKEDRHLLFGVVQDKDFEYMIEEIVASQLFASISVVKLKSARAADMKQLMASFTHEGQEIGCFDTVKEAFETLRSKKQVGERLYIAGSLYLVGEIKELV